MCFAAQLFYPTHSAISCHNVTTYSVRAWLDAAGICQNGIDCELAALDCVPHVDVWGFTDVDRGPPIDIRELPILEMRAFKSRLNACGCRLQISHRELQVPHRHREVHKRHLRTRNFEKKGLQLAISDFFSCVVSPQSIASAQQTIAVFGPFAARCYQRACLARAPPSGNHPKLAGVFQRSRSTDLQITAGRQLLLNTKHRRKKWRHFHAEKQI
jgi:hypothetical protein